MIVSIAVIPLGKKDHQDEFQSKLAAHTKIHIVYLEGKKPWPKSIVVLKAIKPPTHLNETIPPHCLEIVSYFTKYEQSRANSS